MSSLLEVSESGTLQLPAEILQAIGPNTRFVLEVERDRTSLTTQGNYYFDFRFDLGGVRCAPKYFSLR
jgi:hypothetical protein